MLVRVISFVLIALMLLTAASCAADDGANAQDTTTDAALDSTEVEELDSLEARLRVSDDLPETMDFEKRKFRTLTQTEYVGDIWVEVDSGDIVEDAIFNRNRRVEERFNVEIVESVAGSYDAISLQMRNSVNAQDDEFDVFMQHMIQAGIDAQSEIFINLYDLPYVNFEKPWYPSFAVEGLTVNGKMFIGVSDMLLAAIDRTYCMIYDKVVAERYNIHDINDLVNRGEWTVDELIKITKDLYEDDGNGRPDENDFYGFTSPTQNNTTPYYYSFDIPRLEISEDYEVTLLINNDRMVGAVEKLRELFNSTGTYKVQATAGMNMFQKGRAFITSSIVGSTLNNLRDYENDYGIIPYPKYDADQENYYTIMGGGVSTIAVPKTAVDLEYVGAMIELMSAETWKSVVPVYYDIALKVKGTRDEDSIAVLDLLLEGRAVDIALAFDCWKGFCYKLDPLITSNTEWASFYEANQRSVQRHYQEIVDLFLEYDG